MRRFAVIIGLVGVLVTINPAVAHYTQTSKVRYQTSNGQSDWYTVDVNFETGHELNVATRSLDYDPVGRLYAVIFWGPHEATIIESEDVSFCAMYASQSCLPRIQNFTGHDQEGRSWEICVTGWCY